MQNLHGRGDKQVEAPSTSYIPASIGQSSDLVLAPSRGTSSCSRRIAAPQYDTARRKLAASQKVASASLSNKSRSLLGKFPVVERDKDNLPTRWKTWAVSAEPKNS
jgi:hypothetical protein